MPDIVPSGFFVLRTPLLPHSPLTLTVERIRATLADPVVREALFVASPSLDEAIAAWIADPEGPRARGVVEILVRYLVRMSGRATPFGLFSGCTVGTVGDATAFELAPRSTYRRHTRLDTHYLAALCDALVEDEALRERLALRPSNGLYETAARLRYAESRTDPKTRARSYHLVSVEKSDPLDATLARARDGATRGELVRMLVERDPEVASDEARAWIDELVRAQILVSDLAPPITGDEPVRGILATLGDSPERDVLARAERAIDALDAEGLGAPPARYRAVADSLADLPAKAELARLFQVDLYTKATRATIGPAVVNELAAGAELLARIAPPPERPALEHFRKALLERWGARLDGPLSDATTVPLADALDEEAGIGFRAPLGDSREPSPLLEAIALPSGPSRPMVPFGPREQHMLRRIAEAERRGEKEWTLDDGDLAALSAKSPTELPRAFAILATIAAPSPDAIDRGDFRLHLQALNGPSGAILLGRFCHGDPELRRAVEAHLRAEESARPDAVFAEVVHLPEGRLGNVICRPSLRAHEIPYLGRAGAPRDAQIPITDLRIGISRGRLVLWSSRLQREVIPRLTSAHNHEMAALGIYRFLCALQDESHGFTNWSWGALRAAPFLPRVSHGKLVLSAARWTLARDQIASLAKGDAFERVQALRAELRLPRRIGLADFDNVLPIDLEDRLHVESFVQLVKNRGGATLVELFAEDGLVVSGPDGRYVHEIVVPFVRTGTEPAPIVRAEPEAAVTRSFHPGSAWLYAQLFTGTAGVDALLAETVAPLIERARERGLVDRWFFVRFGDPRWHLRLRMRGDATKLLPALEEAVAPLLRDGRVWKLALDTYDREIGRYGGPRAIDAAEAIFEADSDAALAIVQLLESDEGDDERWRLALRGMHLLLCDLGFDLAARTGVLRTVRASFGAEHHVDVEVERQLGAKFRAERAALQLLLAAPEGTDHPLDAGFEVLAKRSHAIAPHVRALASAPLAISMPELAASLLHMHANRMLRAEHRAQELVLYDFLLRLYESEAARARRA